MMRRKVNFRPTWKLNVSEPVSGNYYPVNSRIKVDLDSVSQAWILTDRSQGGTSLTSGQLEVMLHRRLLHDDAFGVGEALNEEAFGKGLVVRGRHVLQVVEKREAAKRHRLKAQEMFMDSLVSFSVLKAGDLTPEKWRKEFLTEESALRNELPINAHFLTLEKTGNEEELLIRLEHIFDSHEDSELSRPIQVDLRNLLAHFDLQGSPVEVILSGNAEKSRVDRLQWHLQRNEIPPINSSPVNEGQTTITLDPMQIRSFLARFRPAAD